MFIFSFCLLVKMNWFYKFGFVELEQTLFCGRYLELAETNQPSLCCSDPKKLDLKA